MRFDVALPSRSMTATGIRDRSVSPEPPNSEPKNAAIAIGAATETSSVRRLKKERIRSLRTSARNAFR